MTSPESQHNSFVDLSGAEAYKNLLEGPLYRPWARVLVDYVNVKAGAHVLDAGTGTGVVAEIAAARSGPSGRVRACDSDEAFAIVARKRDVEINAAPIEHAICPAEELRAKNDSMDFVLCGHALSFFAERVTALREFRRVLKTGGMVGLSVWAVGQPLGLLGDFRQAMSLEGAPEPYPGAYDLTKYQMTPEQIREALTLAGFHRVELEARQMDAWFESIDVAMNAIVGTAFGPVYAKLSPEKKKAVRTRLTRALNGSVREGIVRIPTYANIARAVK